MKEKKNGRPLVFKTPEALSKKIDKYFEKVEQKDITLTGLCLSIGISKVSLNKYMNKEDYKDIVVMAKLKIENAYELSLRKNGRSGDIFALKNFGWVDKTIQQTTNTNINIENLPQEDRDKLLEIARRIDN